VTYHDISLNLSTDTVRWAHVDLAPREPGAGLRAPDIAVRSDARAFLRAANQRLRGAVLDAALVEERRAVNLADRATWEGASVVDRGDWSGPGVHPGRTITTLRQVLPDDGIVTIDAGNFGGWAARGFRYRRPGTFLGPTSGAMGSAPAMRAAPSHARARRGPAARSASPPARTGAGRRRDRRRRSARGRARSRAGGQPGAQLERACARARLPGCRASCARRRGGRTGERPKGSAIASSLTPP